MATGFASAASTISGFGRTPASVGFETVRSRILCPEVRASSIARVRGFGVSRQFVRWENIDSSDDFHPVILNEAKDLCARLHNEQVFRFAQDESRIKASGKIPTAREQAAFSWSNTVVGPLEPLRFSLEPQSPDCRSEPRHCPASKPGFHAPNLLRTS